MSRDEYWIWLSGAIGPGARTDEIFSVYSGPEEIYKSTQTQRAISGAFTATALNRLGNTDLKAALASVEACEKNGWQIITPDSPAYPQSLATLRDMPLVLYCDGDISKLEGRASVAVVGTREPSNEGREIARRISAELAACGAAVISGGALGIDTAAHEGALSADGLTVCVLGCGLGTNYLMSNENLRSEIARRGAVITEYPPFSPASRTTFPLRNRIISGLSRAVIVVEAGEKSGSLITARKAAEQGREVFAVPGGMMSPAYTGANKLIRDGARILTDTREVLLVLEELSPGGLDLSKRPAPEAQSVNRGPVKEQKKERKTLPESLDADAGTVYNLIGTEPVHSDEIAAGSGLPPSRVIAALTVLEINGFIKQTEGKNYIIS
ncbi:MAG: DNA-processing protein DprA [Clostridia bacterium]|nr:DNA-processing protein DprA [Clostridia bacterium]